MFLRQALSDRLGHLLLVCFRVSEEETGSGEMFCAQNKLSEISGRFQPLESVIIPAVPNLVFQIYFKPPTFCVRCAFKSYHLTS